MGPFQIAYGITRKTGLLNFNAMQNLFSWTYFRYKRHLEDSTHHIISRFKDHLRTGNVIDVGANIGYTALLYADALAPGFKVYAFEPEEWNFQLLKRNIAKHHQNEKILPFQKAVGEQAGQIKMALNAFHHADHKVALETSMNTKANIQRSSAVELVTIDSAVISPVSLIKIDVQGFEFHVCKGMSETLKNNPKAIVVLEFSPHDLNDFGNNREELLGFFKLRGYEVSQLDRQNGISPLTYDQIPHLTKKQYIDLIFTH